MDVGTDIVEVARVAKAVRRKRFLERVFSERERQRAETMNERRRGQYFAGLFAAKEAAIKVSGGVVWNYEIGHHENGKPFIVGREEMSLSISHTKTTAIAVVISEK